MSVNSFSFNYHGDASTVKFPANLYAFIEDAAARKAELGATAEIIIAIANQDFVYH